MKNREKKGLGADMNMCLPNGLKLVVVMVIDNTSIISEEEEEEEEEEVKVKQSLNLLYLRSYAAFLFWTLWYTFDALPR